MSRSKRFEKLLSPFQIGKVKLKNRMVKSPQGTGMNDDGRPTDAALGYNEALAKGGVGLIIMGAAAVVFPLGATGWVRRKRAMNDDKLIPVYSGLTRLVHSYGIPFFVELAHGGPAHTQAITGLQPIASSSLTADETPVPAYPTARQLTIDEIKDVQLQFVEAAERAQKAGFDGVELHGAHRYLINSFLSCAWNKRQDEYGCQDLRSRARFAVEIIQAIKERLGQDFPVGIRFNGGEWGLEKGITAEESQAFGKMFEEAGADSLDVSGYCYGNFAWGYWPEQLRLLEPAPEVKPWLNTINRPGFLVTRAEKIKRLVSIPVISGGRMDPELAEWDLQNGKVDLVFMGRRLLADPELPNKVAEGRLEDIAPCTACCECWEATVEQRGPVKCRINAALGKEREYEIKPAGKKKRILVVGGGPAGIEAARVAAMRGHEVILYERQHKLGGQLPLSALIKGLEVEDLVALVRYLKTQIAKLEIREGDWVYIETKRGRIKQKAKITPDVDPRVVEVDYDWWFPEKGTSSLYDWSEANVNVLTDNKPPYSPEVGATTLRGILCKVYKA
jgi:2,4-dienoyl-CoA reductase (NADPH2)